MSEPTSKKSGMHRRGLVLKLAGTLSLTLTVTFAITFNMFNTYTTKKMVNEMHTETLQPLIVIDIAGDGELPDTLVVGDSTFVGGRKLRTGLRWHTEGE